LASLLGIFVALTPLSQLVRTVPGDVVCGGLRLLADGAVPMNLLILGISLVGENSDPVTISPRVVAGAIATRLILVPASCFGAVMTLARLGVMPTDRTFLLTMFVESCAPSAVNIGVICNLHGYKAKEYSRMLFVMYVSAVLSTCVWLTIYLSVLGTGMNP
jgi:predicted permease